MRWFRPLFPFFLAFLMSLSQVGCGSSDNAPECSSDLDCLDDEICINGECVFGAESCVDDGDCLEGEACVGGFCENT